MVDLFLGSGKDFDGDTVGLANKFAMCTENSGGVNQVRRGRLSLIPQGEENLRQRLCFFAGSPRQPHRPRLDHRSRDGTQLWAVSRFAEMHVRPVAQQLRDGG